MIWVSIAEPKFAPHQSFFSIWSYCDGRTYTLWNMMPAEADESVWPVVSQNLRLRTRLYRPLDSHHIKKKNEDVFILEGPPERM